MTDSSIELNWWEVKTTFSFRDRDESFTLLLDPRIAISSFMPASSQSSELIDPSSLIPSDWVLSRKSMQSGGLIVEHHIQPADIIESPPISQHVMALFLSDSPRQTTQFDKLEFDGTMRPGDLWLLPAARSSALWAWESTDEVIVFTIDPPLLDEIALASDCVNSSGLELQPLVYQHDPQLLSIAQSFKQEMTQGGIAAIPNSN